MVSKKSKRLIRGTRPQIVTVEDTPPVQKKQEVKSVLKEEEKSLKRDFIKQIIWEVIILVIVLFILFLFLG